LQGEFDRHGIIVAQNHENFDLTKRTYVRYSAPVRIHSDSGDHEIEQLRRSLAMLPAGSDALKREEALFVMARLRDVTTRLRRLETGLQALLDPEPNRSPLE